MAGWRNCTISDICIDYLTKNSFNLFIERTSDGSENEWDWIAKKTDLHLHATDPVRLVALCMLGEDWINKRKHYKNEETNQRFVSVFVGICKSQQLLDEYIKQDYELLSDNHNQSAFGADFNILYDDECLVTNINAHKSNNVEEIFADLAFFETDLLKQDYQNNLDKTYNVAIVIKNLKYKGKRKEILNDKFGYFKYLGTYPQIIVQYIADAGNTYQYAVDKLIQWGYSISVGDDSVEFSEYCDMQIAEKNKKIYLATDPLRLLGFVAMIEAYGEDWAWSDVVRSFSVQPAKKSSN